MKKKNNRIELKLIFLFDKSFHMQPKQLLKKLIVTFLKNDIVQKSLKKPYIFLPENSMDTNDFINFYNKVFKLFLNKISISEAHIKCWEDKDRDRSLEELEEYPDDEFHFWIKENLTHEMIKDNILENTFYWKKEFVPRSKVTVLIIGTPTGKSLHP